MSHPSLSFFSQEILVYLSEHGRESDNIIPTEKWDEDEQRLANDEFLLRGYIQDVGMSLDGRSTFTLTPAGRRAAKQLEPRVKRQGLYREVLGFLKKECDISAHSLRAKGEASPTDAETEAAIRWCALNGLITVKAESWEGLYRATLTNAGQDALASDYGPEDYLSASECTGSTLVNNNYSQHYSGPNVTINGHGSAVSLGSGNASSTDNIISTN